MAIIVLLHVLIAINLADIVLYSSSRDIVILRLIISILKKFEEIAYPMKYIQRPMAPDNQWSSVEYRTHLMSNDGHQPKFTGHNLSTVIYHSEKVLYNLHGDRGYRRRPTFRVCDEPSKNIEC